MSVVRFSTSASPAAQAAWHALDRGQQIALLARVARRLRSRPRSRHPRLGSGVVRVGFGRRERRTGRLGRKRHQDDLALHVYVRSKWRGETTSDRTLRPVPSWISLRTSIPARLRASSSASAAKILTALRRRRAVRPTRLVGLPTDVRQVGPRPRAEGAQIVEARGTRAVAGTACLPVREVKPNAPLRLLGCHHVLWCSLKGVGATRDLNATTYDAAGVALGKPLPGFDLLPVPVEGNVDAAIASLDSAAAVARVTDPSFWRFTKAERPVTAVRSQQEIELLLTNLGETAYLYPPAMSGAPRRIELRLLEFALDSIVEYQQSSVSLAELVVFQPVGAATQAGYSGSPVIAGGVFVGMHVAGSDRVGSDGVRRVRSYVQPAYRMLPRGVHTLRLELAAKSIRF